MIADRGYLGVVEIAHAGQRFAKGVGVRDRGVDLRRNDVNRSSTGARKGENAMLMMREAGEEHEETGDMCGSTTARNGQLEFSSVAMPRLSGSREGYCVVNGITR